jgi:hypothetical protein
MQDEALQRFCVLALAQYVCHAKSVSIMDGQEELPLQGDLDGVTHPRSMIARLLFELVKVVSIKDMWFIMRVIERMVLEEPVWTMPLLYDTITCACDASRRTILTEWYLHLTYHVCHV